LISVIGYCVFRSNKKMILSILVVVFGIFMLFAAPPGYWQEIGTISEEASKKSERLDEQYGTGAQRLYSWKLGWEMFKDNPIAGIGQGNYPWHVTAQEEKMKIQWRGRSLGGRAAHSMYFTLLPELGLIGVTLFFLMIFYSIKDINYIKRLTMKGTNRKALEDKNTYYYALSIEASIIAYLTSSIFISTLYYPNIWLMMGMLVAFKNIIEKKYASANINVVSDTYPGRMVAC